MQRRVWIGTSGWVYKHWAQNFYPKGWPKKKEFAYYVRHFPTVEINATFYRLPSLRMVRGWREQAPAGFVFAVKGSRYLTHLKRLRDTGRGLTKYFRRLAPLRERIGAILWQLPPNFVKHEENLARLRRFLRKLPRDLRHAVEFRHPSWMDEQTFALLREHGVANVWLSSLRMPRDYTVTADFVYLRFHGLRGGAYHDYTDSELEPWARQLSKAARKGIPSYVYFNNDLNTRAPLNAAALSRMLGAHAVGPNVKVVTELPAIAAPERGPETWPSWSSRSKRRSAASPPPRARARRHAAPPSPRTKASKAPRSGRRHPASNRRRAETAV